MRSQVIKRSIVRNGHKTSVSLENEFWDGLREIAAHENTTLAELVAQIDYARDNCNLSSSIRVFVFSHFRARLNSQNSALGRKDFRAGLNQSAVEG
ncbi:MAG TPA: ribbon-helix-helix domain-containing protein [Pseudolabrys sp.]|jgi:predicted DNA-binding ribbon-helix-helix protein|nr:ribbon-helix-helix domain-containing protein [Pseudolabrys sp.]